jgi:hypothetical protein
VLIGYTVAGGQKLPVAAGLRDIHSQNCPTGGLVQAVENLPHKHEALSSNSNITKKMTTTKSQNCPTESYDIGS